MADHNFEPHDQHADRYGVGNDGFVPQLGEVVKTEYGTKGVVNCISKHISGCDRIEIKPDASNEQMHSDGEFYYPAELNHFDDDQETQELPECNVELGNIVKDTINEVEGIVTIIAFRRYNCPQICIKPRQDDLASSVDDASRTSAKQTSDGGFDSDSEWADLPAVEVIDEGKAEQFRDLQTESEATETGSVGSSKHDPTIPQ